MNKNKTLIRGLAFLLAGIFIALVFTITPGTYSLFRKEYIGPTTMVKAGGTKDFIKESKIEYRGKAPYLKLKRADDVDYAPVIFFSIEGELKEYILHMDSVKLDNESSIPIIPNINLPQSISLILSPKKEIKGKIKIKHLNDFINETVDLSISKDYLLERYFLNRGHKNFKMGSLSNREKDEMGKLVKEMISHTSPYMDWDKVIWEDRGNKIEELGKVGAPISKAKLSSDQAAVIDLIAPNLLNYNEKLYSLLEIMVRDLNLKIDENNLLKKEKQELLDKSISLEATIIELNDQVKKLKVENNGLYDQVNRLKTENEGLYNQIRENDRMYDEIRDLKFDNDELYNVRRDFGIERGGLYNHIRYLEESIRANSRPLPPMIPGPAEPVVPVVPVVPVEEKGQGD